MKSFMEKNFLLETLTAQNLYHETAKSEPIFDYHCHLNPAQIAENKRFKTITEAWLGGDHYKWRMMRAMGFDEYYITGEASDYEKFLAWTKTVQELIGNPLYHWTHLELQRYFDIYEPLTEQSAPLIWEKTNQALQHISVRDIFEKFNVYAVGTTDDPVDSLEFHKAIADGNAPIGKIKTKILPSFRPDKALNIEKAGFAEYISLLSSASGVKIDSVDALLAALENRIAFFVAQGCRVSDHGLEEAPFVLQTDAEIEKSFKAALEGKIVTGADAQAFKTKILTALAACYAKHNIAMQLHFASIRNVNSRMFKILGADTGYDAVHDRPMSAALAGLLNLMEQQTLPKTILYSLNPTDYYPLATIMGGFQHNYSGKNNCGVKGKMQFGSAWWFCDHKNGMEEQMSVLADTGLLSAFIGMLTDSRSFLSFPRHEYFRRILCNMLGNWVENGEYPLNENLKQIVKNICFENVQAFLE